MVDIPTGKVIEHGIFNLGTYFGFRNEGELPRDEVALQLDFGLFDRVEIGLTSVRHNQRSFLLGNLQSASAPRGWDCPQHRSRTGKYRRQY